MELHIKSPTISGLAVRWCSCCLMFCLLLLIVIMLQRFSIYLCFGGSFSSVAAFLQDCKKPGHDFALNTTYDDVDALSYDALLATESDAISGRKGIHSAKDPPVMHITELTIASSKKVITFAFSGVRCPGCDEPYSDEAIALMRRKIMQRDVEIEVEAVDRTGIFLGPL